MSGGEMMRQANSDSSGRAISMAAEELLHPLVFGHPLGEANPLLAWIFNGSSTFDRIGAPLLGVFPFVIMFLLTSVAMLRERTSGTLERRQTSSIESNGASARAAPAVTGRPFACQGGHR